MAAIAGQSHYQQNQFQSNNQQPLPPGWESKWDPNQGRYFYINHALRTTSWSDPRIAQQQKQQQQQMDMQQQYYQQNQQNYHNQNLLNQQQEHHQTDKDMSISWLHDSEDDHHSSQEPITVDLEKFERLKKMFPDGDSEMIKRSLLMNKNVEGMAIVECMHSGMHCENDNAEKKEWAMAIQRLKQEFSGALPGLVKDVHTQCDHNEAKARQKLLDLGYESVKGSPQSLKGSPQKIPPSTNTTCSVMPSNEEHFRSSTLAHQEILDKAKSPSTTDTKPISKYTQELMMTYGTSPKQITELQKIKIKDEILKEFTPKLSSAEIEKILEICHCNESKTRAMLKAMISEKASPKHSASKLLSPKKISSNSSVSSHAGSKEDIHNVAIVLNDNVVEDSSSIRGSLSPGFKAVSFAEPGTSSDLATMSSQTSLSSTSHPRLKNKESEKHHTSPNKHKKGKSSPITKSTSKDGDITEHAYGSHSLAKGPDPSLAKGPDRSLLLANRTSVLPKISKRTSDECIDIDSESGFRVVPKGPDTSLVNGPDESLLMKHISSDDFTFESIGQGPSVITNGPNPAHYKGPSLSKYEPSKINEGVCAELMKAICLTHGHTTCV